jgi:hypothetical protein
VSRRGAFAETVRCRLGDLSLTLNGAGAPRTYTSLVALEHDAFMSRIWGVSISGTRWTTPT